MHQGSILAFAGFIEFVAAPLMMMKIEGERAEKAASLAAGK